MLFSLLSEQYKDEEDGKDLNTLTVQLLQFEILSFGRN